MGTSHFKSNVAAKAGTETITGFATIGSAVIEPTSYIKVGTRYIFFGDAALATSAVAAATALVGTAFKGSLYIGDGKLFVMSADNTATSKH